MKMRILALIGLAQAIKVNKSYGLTNQEFLYTLMNADPPKPAVAEKGAPAAAKGAPAAAPTAAKTNATKPGENPAWSNPFMNWWEV